MVEGQLRRDGCQVRTDFFQTVFDSHIVQCAVCVSGGREGVREGGRDRQTEGGGREKRERACMGACALVQCLHSKQSNWKLTVFSAK